jgi:hypothetical protein
MCLAAVSQIEGRVVMREAPSSESQGFLPLYENIRRNQKRNNMLILGLLSIIQAVFLPGIAASFFIKNLCWVDRILLAIPLSVAINYALVLGLTLAGMYSRPVIFMVVAVEILVLFAILAKEIRTSRMRCLGGGYPQLTGFFKKQPMELFIYFLLAVFLIRFSHEAWKQFGTVFSHWDAVVSWNRWAVTWFHGELPHGTWQYPDASQTYPQGIPILYSMTYQFIGDIRVQFFAKAIAMVFPFAALATFLRMAFLFESGRSILLLSVPIFIMLLAKGYGGMDFIFSGYVDTPIAYFGVLACYLFMLLNQRRTQEGEGGQNDNLIYAAVTIVAATALLKQTGVLVAVMFPLAWFYYFGIHSGRQARIKLLWLYLIVAVLAGHWYVYKAIQIHNGTDISLLSSYNSLIQTEWYERPFSAAKLFFKTYGWFWLLPFVMGFRYPAIRVLALWGILPVFLFWAILVSYDMRGFYLAMPWIAIVLSAGCYRLYELARSKPLPLPAVVVVLSLAATISAIRLSLPEVTQKLVNKSIAYQQGIGSPELNKYLLKLYSEDGGSGYMATSYQFAGFIPGLQERFKLAQCGDLTFLTMLPVRYYLHAPYCSLVQRDDFERNVGNANFKKLMELEGFVLYEIYR